MKREKLLYTVMAVGVVSVWGVTFINTKILLRTLTPLEIMLLRCSLAYLLLLLFYPRLHRSEGLRHELSCLGAALCGITLYFLAENYALSFTQAANVSLLVSAAPILTAAVAHFLGDERFSRRSLYGFFAAFSGIFLVVCNGRLVLRLSPAGDLLALAAALSWAFYTVIMRRIRSAYPPIYITRRIFLYAVAAMLPLCLVPGMTGDGWRSLGKPEVWGNLLFLGVAASAACYVIWGIIVRRMGAVWANRFVYLNPVVTMAASALVLRERITVLMVLGAVMILAGVVIADRPGQKQVQEGRME